MRKQIFDKQATSTRYLEMWTMIPWLATSISVLTFQAPRRVYKILTKIGCRLLWRISLNKIIFHCEHVLSSSH